MNVRTTPHVSVLRRRFIGVVMGALLAASTSVVSAEAPSDAMDPGGYVGKGRLAVRTALGVRDFEIAGDLAFETRGMLARLDLLSLTVPHGDGAPAVSAMGSSIIPDGGITVVIDRARSRFVAWSKQNRRYYRSPAPAPTSAPTSAASPGPSASPTSAPSRTAAGAFGAIRMLRDLKALAITLTLVGRGTVAGHPTTNFDYTLSRTTEAGRKLDVQGRLQFADDLDDLPIALTANLSSNTLPTGSMSMIFSSIQVATPDAGDFDVPVGYTQVTEPMMLLAPKPAP